MMRTIIGNCFFWGTLFLWSVATIADIKLGVRNADGIDTTTIVAGQPFTVEVAIDGVQGSVQAPTIQGLDQLGARRTGMYMSSINGVSTTKYTYQLLLDKPGTYTLGPATGIYQQQTFVAPSVSIIVSAASDAAHVQSAQQKKNQKEVKAFVRLTVDSDRVVVGQKIHATLRFYYQDAGLTLTNIGQPDLTHFDIQEMGKPIGGTAEVNGGQYRYAEWHWDMYPKQAGELVIPAYSADYEFPVHDNNRFFGSFFMMMGTRSERKRVYSNAVKVAVDPLPYSPNTVHAIGSFESITASISPAIAKEGEGMVMALEICGEGNMHTLQMPRLIMPAELKYYDSHSCVIEPRNEDELPRKKSEFIVQGMKIGDWEIPAQEFTYFDVKKHAYVTLRTSPLAVTIQALSHKHNEQMNMISATPPIVPVNGEHILPLHSSKVWYPVSERDPLPWSLFYLFMFAPLIFYGFSHVRHYVPRLYYPLTSLRRRAYRTARKKIIRCAQQADAHSLYTIFVELFALLMHKQTSEISTELISQYVKICGLSQQECADWNLFFERVLRATYAQHDNREYELCRMATQWIDRLEKGA